jgi:hypothetical protein
MMVGMVSEMGGGFDCSRRMTVQRSGLVCGEKFFVFLNKNRFPENIDPGQVRYV